MELYSYLLRFLIPMTALLLGVVLWLGSSFYLRRYYSLKNRSIAKLEPGPALDCIAALIRGVLLVSFIFSLIFFAATLYFNSELILLLVSVSNIFLCFSGFASTRNRNLTTLKISKKSRLQSLAMIPIAAVFFV